MNDKTNDASTSKVPALIQFARYWSANMDLVHRQGNEWPGFGYTDDEKERMHAISENLPFGQFLFETLIIVIFTITIAAVFIAIMFHHLNVKYGSDPSKTPGSEFFLCLAAAGVGTLAGGLPASILLASGIMGRFCKVNPSTLPDETFARHLISKSIRQIVRMSIVMCIALAIYCIFVPTDSKLNLFLQVVAPVLGPVVTGMTALYYGIGRMRK